MSKNLEVGIGKVKLGRNNDILHTTLGSCIGVSFSWPKKSLFGLAHCLLPQSPRYNRSLGAKYVDQGIRTLIRLMKISSEEFGEIEVCVAGGSQMFRGRTNLPVVHVGKKNIESVKRHLSEHGFTIEKLSTGGTRGRRMSVSCFDALVTVKMLGRSE